MNPQTAWQWAVQGLGGVTNILRGISEHPEKCGPDHLAALQRYVNDLQEVLTREQEKQD